MKHKSIRALAQCSAIKAIYPATQLDLGPAYEPVHIEFEVQQSDINLGIRKDCFNCATALALQRALGPKWQCQVHPLVAAVRRISNGEVYYYRVPEATRRFIQQFDHPGEKIGWNPGRAVAIRPCKLRIVEWDPQPTVGERAMIRDWPQPPQLCRIGEKA